MTVNVLALCGSLRQTSSNAALLRAAASLPVEGLTVSVYPSLGTLPLFSPDYESPFPDAVQALHQAVQDSDALLIASPEYAHGVTGTIKNALDWLVSLTSFAGKPVAVLNASARSRHADAALRETLITMSAQLVQEASVTIPLPGSSTTQQKIEQSPALCAELRAALQALQATAQQSGARAGHGPTDTGPLSPLH